MTRPALQQLILDRLRFGLRQRTEFIAQSEAAECGLACMAMIARHHGHDTDLQALRRRFSSSLAGSSLQRLVEIAESLSLAARPLKLDLEELPQLRTPCILHWDLNHYVVLEACDGKRAKLLDPGCGRRTLPLAEVSRHFTGIALELARKPQFKKLRERRKLPWRSLIGSVTGLRRALTQVLLLSVALEVFVLVVPLLTQWLIDQVIALADRDLLGLIMMGMVFAFVFQSVVGALRSWVVLWISTLMKVQWSSNVFAHLLRLPVDFFEKRHMGDLLSRAGSADSIQRTISTRLVEAVLDGSMLLLTLAFIYNYSVSLTVITVLTVVAYAALRWFSYVRLEESTHTLLIGAAKVQSEMMETIRGISTIKPHNHTHARSARYTNASVEVANSSIHVQRIEILFGALSRMTAGTSRILTLWLGARMVLDNALTIGMLMAFIAYAEQVVARGSALIDKGIELRMLRLQAERLSEIVLATPEKNLEGKFAGSLANADIQVDNISFRYGKGERWVLLNCGFSVAAGESVALVGPSGCGKTTLVKLMLGLLRPSAGAIRVGGVDIRTLGLERYRDMVGSVMQDDRLFSGTIAENISFFDPQASAERIREVAKAAAIDEEIRRMPMGYETLVGDMGSTLSGGQKQRILLARALYRRPAILVLDEATSHLDTEREHSINQVVSALSITRIIVAHRRETIASAQRIVRIDPQGGAIELKAASHAA